MGNRTNCLTLVSPTKPGPDRIGCAGTYQNSTAVFD